MGCTGNANDLARANIHFHRAIYEAAHNEYLIKSVQDLNDSLALLPRTTFVEHDRVQTAKLEHAAIFSAIEASDAERAEQAARDHIHKALDGRLKLMFT